MKDPAYAKKYGVSSRSNSRKNMHKRTQSQGASFIANNSASRYKNIPTDNIKFQQFIDLLFESKMNKEDMKMEMLTYVQALETNYTGTIAECKVRNERLKK